MCCAAQDTLFDTIVRPGEYIPVDTSLYLMRRVFLEWHRTLLALSYQAYHVRLVCSSLILQHSISSEQPRGTTQQLRKLAFLGGVL